MTAHGIQLSPKTPGAGKPSVNLPKQINYGIQADMADS
jgi:hypothetical protein